jgi:hypothetical protein
MGDVPIDFSYVLWPISDRIRQVARMNEIERILPEFFSAQNC